MDVLAASGVDMIALETFPMLTEAGGYFSTKW
jgi:S-methylmethionine-dependent homocysteine/selenocysteine methylase